MPREGENPFAPRDDARSPDGGEVNPFVTRGDERSPYGGPSIPVPFTPVVAKVEEHVDCNVDTPSPTPNMCVPVRSTWMREGEGKRTPPVVPANEADNTTEKQCEQASGVHADAASTTTEVTRRGRPTGRVFGAYR